MNLSEKKILDISESIIKNHGFFLVDFIVRGTNRDRILEFYVDGKENVSADDCAKVSREISKQIEENNLLEGSYRLDVSSPGIDRPLLFIEQFPKHIGRKFDISYTDGDSTKKLAGKLIGVEDEVLVFNSNNNEVRINFNNIKKAKVIISFS